MADEAKDITKLCRNNIDWLFIIIARIKPTNFFQPERCAWYIHTYIHLFPILNTVALRGTLLWVNTIDALGLP